ncbi:MAG TPA: (Fe-S)-binding protein [Nitrosomonas mobilis]|nr:(Fe-S)-binding protein [Nitrosomonas mobilis]
MQQPPIDSIQNTIQTALLAEANQCVACGLCLPHCPTYRLTMSEADSPRGRIALMSGVAMNRIPMNDRFIQHMDRCLTCRACESVCPSQVAYGQLIDTARVMIRRKKIYQGDDVTETLAATQRAPDKTKDRLRTFLEQQLIAKPSRFDVLRPWVRLLVKSGVLAGLLRLKFFKRNALLQSQWFLTVRNLPGYRWQQCYPAKGMFRGEVGLFLGCVARISDSETLLSSIRLLTQLGYTVHVPKTQTCCGALHQHSGRVEEAVNFAECNQQAFSSLNIQAIISTASGCGAQLLGHAEQGRVDGSPVPVLDISQFLARQNWSEIKFNSLRKKVLVHEPCTLRNVLHAADLNYSLLALIPELEVRPLEGNDQCCGAAGTYFLDQPKFAEALLDSKVTALKAAEANYLVTANIGCALHIGNGLLKKGINMEVLHPVTLLARQMCLQ